MNLITPYGDKLVSLVRRAGELFSLQLSARALCDLELLATGAFSPLDRFMGKADGTRFPIPITLEVDQAEGLLGKEIALRSAKNNLIGWMKVEEVYERNSVSGPLRVIELPKHADFPSLRRTSAEVRALLAAMGKANVVAFQPRGPIDRAHEEIIRRAAREVDGALLIQPIVGMTQPGDIDHYTRVRTYKTLVENHFDPNSTLLNLLPLALHRAGPREILAQAMIARNFGATHFLVAAGDAGDLAAAAEIGIRLVPYDAPTNTLSENEMREEYLAKGRPLPEWFARKEIAAILANSYPPRHKRGFCIWFTGLPSSGKSTVAEALIVMLMEHGRQVTILDGDVVRTHLSKGLGFSKEDRDTNILRIGFVASEIVRHNGAVICAAVSPYRHTRDQARSMMGDAFIEVFVDTPAEECERRDVKGFYAQARDGKIQGFTGVDDPYEPPLTPEVRLSTAGVTAGENAARIVQFLVTRGLLLPEDSAGSF